jgi:hypothetical protein
MVEMGAMLVMGFELGSAKARTRGHT